MSDEEYDFDQLQAFLDESDDEDEYPVKSSAGTELSSPTNMRDAPDDDQALLAETSKSVDRDDSEDEIRSTENVSGELYVDDMQPFLASSDEDESYGETREDNALEVERNLKHNCLKSVDESSGMAFVKRSQEKDTFKYGKTSKANGSKSTLVTENLSLDVIQGFHDASDDEDTSLAETNQDNQTFKVEKLASNGVSKGSCVVEDLDADAMEAFLHGSDDEDRLLADRNGENEAQNVEEISKDSVKKNANMSEDLDVDGIQEFLDASDDEDMLLSDNASGQSGLMNQKDLIDQKRGALKSGVKIVDKTVHVKLGGHEDRSKMGQDKSKHPHSAELPQSTDEPSKDELKAKLKQMEEEMIRMREILEKSSDVSESTLSKASDKKIDSSENFPSKSLPDSHLKMGGDKHSQIESSKNNRSSRHLLKEMDTNPFFNETSGENEDLEPVKQSELDQASFKSSKNATEEEIACFGSDSEDELQELEEKYRLSKRGKEIDVLLKSGERQRTAHVPNYDVSKVLPNKNRQTWKTKVPSAEGGSTSKLPAQKEDKSKEEPLSGLSIINPKVSSHFLKSKMTNKKMVKISSLDRRSVPAEQDWVTVGVVVQKTETRQGSNGKNFIILKLSDLDDCDKLVALFLFGDAYTQLWKTTVGTVIGILNAEVMKETDKSKSSEVAICVNQPGKVLVVGESKDFGMCKATTKLGKPCTHFVNKRQGEHCTYHIRRAYNHMSSKRGELQSIAGRQPKSFEKRLTTAGKDFLTDRGELFSTAMNRQKSRKLVGLKHVAQFATKGKVSTAAIHSLLPEDRAKLKELKSIQQEKLSAKQQDFLDMLAKPTPGSMQLIASMKQKDQEQKENTTEGPSVRSVKVSDFLRQSQREMQQRFGQPSQKLSAEQVVPKLGRGFQQGQDIILSDSPGVSRTRSALVAKHKAIAKIAAKGGIEKEDPNTLRRKLKSPEHVEVLKRRAAEDSTDNHTDEDTQNITPPKKKSRLLGNLDLDSEEVQKLLKKKSKHAGILAEVEMERQEKYFNALEKKEKMEEKMSTIMEKTVTVLVCKKCAYSAFTQSDLCKQQGHQVVRTKAKQRYFKCKECNGRTSSFDRLPSKPCKKCGANNYERVSMFKEKKGPELPQEQLLLRGEERKFVSD